jgi:hypothetical protein
MVGLVLARVTAYEQADVWECEPARRKRPYNGGPMALCSALFISCIKILSTSYQTCPLHRNSFTKPPKRNRSARMTRALNRSSENTPIPAYGFLFCPSLQLRIQTTLMPTFIPSPPHSRTKLYYVLTFYKNLARAKECSF